MKYSGKVYGIDEFDCLVFDLSVTSRGTLSDGLLKSGEWVSVTPYGDRWAEIVDDDYQEEPAPHES